DERLSKRYFQGMPVPAAAGILASTILFYGQLGISGGSSVDGLWRWLPLFLVFILGVLMVSSLRFRSFKDFSWHRKHPFFTLVAVVIILTLLTIHYAVTLFIIGAVYLFSVFHSHKEYRQLLSEGKEIENDEVKDFTV
ncbi:CDP-alcohol phosphatidyltransferase family protein, partial [Magnetococcales bacterium HHB-1]